MLIQIPRIFKYRHHNGYYNYNFNLDGIVILLRKASCIRQTQYTCYVLCYVMLYIQYVSITRAIIRYHYKNKEKSNLWVHYNNLYEE